MSEEVECSDEPVTLTILHSGNGMRQKVHISLSCSLQDLKDEISKNPSVSNAEQRIFFMGRELKNNRSLSSLGIGKLGIFVLHLHYKKCTQVVSKAELLDRSILQKNPSTLDPKQQTKTNEIIELIDSSPPSHRRTHPTNNSSTRKRAAVNNLTSSSQTSSRNGPSAASDTIILLDDEHDNEVTRGLTSRHRRVKAKSSGVSATIDLSDL